MGDGNTVMGYNSFASGKENRAEGNYSIALGYQAKAVNNNTFAWSGKSSAYTISGLGQFGIDPINGISGFYIGDKSLDHYLKISSTAVNDLKSKISSAVSSIAASPLSSLNISSSIENAISAIVSIRDILSSLY